MWIPTTESVCGFVEATVQKYQQIHEVRRGAEGYVTGNALHGRLFKCANSESSNLILNHSLVCEYMVNEAVHFRQQTSAVHFSHD